MSGNALRTIVIFLTLLMFHPNAVNAQQGAYDSQVKAALRMIGHEVLLVSSDSTSRVLPVERVKNRYHLRFEREFSFEPDLLAGTVNRVMRQTGLSGHYIVEVVECGTQAVVYSYEMSDLHGEPIIPCKGRQQPDGCYGLWFTLLDGTPLLVQPEQAEDYDLATGTGVGSSIAPFLIAALLIAVLLGTLVIYRTKVRQPQHRLHSDAISLGDYQFDKRNTELHLGRQRIELTGKEADLLSLLYDAVNTTIERDVILHRVWGDDGDYVGRTLDVFISKLRKKLKGDPKVRIVNTRGVGYKLVLDS